MKYFMKDIGRNLIIILSGLLLLPLVYAPANSSEWIDSDCWVEGDTKTCQRFGIGKIKKINKCEYRHQRVFQQIDGKGVSSKYPREKDFVGAKFERNGWETINCCKMTVNGGTVVRGEDPNMDYEVMRAVCRNFGY